MLTLKKGPSGTLKQKTTEPNAGVTGSADAAGAARAPTDTVMAIAAIAVAILVIMTTFPD
ncbi:hypothetical protein ACQP2U_21350 [Nocardia sp. CA-084685]|uniref:hypothetical protein n=1 Tax=Nocardia sp. CA-084685 TaxID=3239970 RepID=UPI003D97898A